MSWNDTFVPRSQVYLFTALLLGNVIRCAREVSAEGEDGVIGRALAECPELRELVRSADWVENLANPVLETEEQVQDARRRYKRISTYLSRLESRQGLPATLKAIKAGADYFLIFAGPPPANAGDQIVIRGGDPIETPDHPELKRRVEVLLPDGSKHVIEVPELEPVLPKMEVLLPEPIDLIGTLYTRRETVSLETTTDPAIVKLRDQVGLIAPKGFVYLVYYRDRKAIPEMIRPAFQDSQTRAVTFLSRYVAVLSEEVASPGERELKKSVEAKALSHELVHVYLNCSIPLVDHAKLPKWFHEGCAIHFSGSGETESVTTVQPAPWWSGPGKVYTTYSVASPKEYAEYKAVFEYLRSQFGRAEFDRLVKDAVEMRSADRILEKAGAASFEGLLVDAKAWMARKYHLKWGAILAAVLLVLYWLWRKLPKDQPVADV